MYDVALLLQTDNSLTIFERHFRPWPHIFQDLGRSKKFYAGIDRHLERDRIALQNYDAREDSEKYKTILQKILALFGLGIIDSFEYTVGKYLRQTNGALANENREEWEEKAIEGMLCHNNHAERPFADLWVYK